MVRQLLVLSGMAAIGAVINHSAHFVITDMFWWTDRYRAVTVPNFDAVAGISFYVQALIVPIAVTAVPAFLFISGFFVSAITRRDQKRVAWNPVLSRIRSLLWPYILWSLIIICLTAVLEDKTYTLRSLAWALVTGSATAAFYYIPLLILLYLLSPFVSPIAKDNPWLLIGFGALLLGCAIVSRYAYFYSWESPYLEVIFKFFRNWQFSANFFWFALGIVIGFHLMPVKKWLVRYRWWLLMAMCLSYVLALIEWNTLRYITGLQWLAQSSTALNQLFMLLLLLTYLAFTNITYPFSAQLGEVGSRAYGIYLIHIPVLTIMAKSMYHLVPALLGWYLVFQAILVVAGVGVPLLMMAVVCRSPISRYYQYIFG
jgi:peptidoglycan/LPS O-acetylase OafA/YrhL